MLFAKTKPFLGAWVCKLLMKIGRARDSRTVSGCFLGPPVLRLHLSEQGQVLVDVADYASFFETRPCVRGVDVRLILRDWFSCAHGVLPDRRSSMRLQGKLRFGVQVVDFRGNSVFSLLNWFCFSEARRGFWQ